MKPIRRFELVGNHIACIVYDPLRGFLVILLVGSYPNQCKVGGPSADVTYENRLARLKLFRPSLFVPIKPSVKCRLRFLDEKQILDARLGRGFDRQSPRHFVKGRRQRHNRILLTHREARKLVIPTATNVLQITSTRFYR